MGLCTKRRIYFIFLLITVLQIATTAARQIFDFLGPLWALILSNFFNIVVCIFGFFGGYTRRTHFLITYIVWSILWSGWNIFILCLYIPISRLEVYKSGVLSAGTGGFSWWETRAPGCVPDWASETRLVVTNCYFDPQVVECVQAGVQIYLAIWGVISAISIILCPPKHYDEKDGSSMKSSDGHSGRVPTFMGYSSASNSISRHSRSSTRTAQRGALKVPSPSPHRSQGHSTSNGDPSNNHLASIDDRLRPMTPRKVKRRSARSIQSQRYGPQQQQAHHGMSNGGIGKGGHFGENDSGPGPSSSRFPQVAGINSSNSGSNRNSLRSNASRRSSNHRNSKRKANIAAQHFISPVNRLMQQQQLQQQHLDSETSHDEPRFNRRDQGHTNPVYLGQQTTRNPPAPPRPPSARSSYSNYHPARLPINSASGKPNIFNLNQNVFTNAAFDTSTEYNDSQLSNNTNGGFYEEEVEYHPMSQIQPQYNHHNNIPPVPMPRPANPILHPPPPPHFSDLIAQHGAAGSNRNEKLLSPNPTLVYPLAHSPVSQDSFPMWGIAQAQVPTQSPSSSGYPALTATNRPYPYSNPISKYKQAQSQQPTNSETVI